MSHKLSSIVKILIVTFCMINSGCTAWTTWTAKRPDNMIYKDAGYGYKRSIYSRENLFYLERDLQARAEDGELIDLNSERIMEERLSRSKYVAEVQNEEAIENYISSYDDTKNHSPYSRSSTKASKLSYFDLSLYGKATPIENLINMTEMRTASIFPMSPKTRAEFLQYIKIHEKTTDDDSALLQEGSKTPDWESKGSKIGYILNSGSGKSKTTVKNRYVNQNRYYIEADIEDKF